MKRLLSLLLIVSVVAAACGSDDETIDTGGAASPTAADGDWVLTAASIDGEEVQLLDDHRVTLSIDGTQLGGTAACNSYGGTITFTGDEVRVGELAWTEMGCEQRAMALEAAFLAALLDATAWEHTGSTLRLLGDGLVLTFGELAPVPAADLVDTVWTLDTLIQGEAASTTLADAEPARLELRADGTLIGSTGCRGLTGEYQIAGDEVLFTTFSAEGECPAPLASQDSLVVSVLGDGFTVAIDGARLTVMSRGGEGLSYTSN